MPDERDLIRGRVDLVDLVGERVKLIRVGKKLKGLCPFHAEKTPSFHVDQQLQLFHCFGCKKGGDIFDWVMATENVDFRAALENLAERAGVQLSGKGRSRDEVASLFAIMEEAQCFFRSAFVDSSSAREYIAARGLDDETIEHWGIGYAPPTDFAMATHFRQTGTKLHEARDLSLLSGGPEDGYGDFFRGRLLFPIRDEQGRLMAFSGRSMDGSEPKYINSRDTSLFKKSDTLYGMYQSREGLRDSRNAVLVEGQMDVIACHRAGIATAVAALGTALTAGHIQKLKRYADEAVLLYDGDTAGKKAAERAIAIFEAASFPCKAVLLAPGQDPDTQLSQSGAEALRQTLQGAVSPLRFRIKTLIEEFGAEPGIKDVRFWENIKQALAHSNDRLEADELIDEVSALHPNSKVDRRATVNAIRADVESLRKPRAKLRRNENTVAEIPDEIPLPRGPERDLLRAAVSEEFRSFSWPLLDEEDLIVSEGGRLLADGLLAAFPERPEGEPSAIVGALEHPMRTALFRLESPADPFDTSAPPLSQEGLNESVERLRAERERRERQKKFRTAPSIETAMEIYPSSN